MRILCNRPSLGGNLRHRDNTVVIEASAWNLLPEDPWLRLAVITGTAVYLVAGLQVLLVTWLHFAIRHRERRDQLLKRQFLPLFLYAIEDLPGNLPKVSRADLQSVLLQWLFFVETTRGDSRQRLRDLGCQLDFPRKALVLLKQRSLASRMIAIASLGRLKDPAASPELLEIIDGDDPVLSLLAMRALTQIDAEEGIEQLLQRLVSHRDWAPSRLNTLFREMPETVAGPALLKAIQHATPESTPRLLPLLQIVQPGGAWAWVDRLLAKSDQVDILAPALQAVADPRSLPHIRRLCDHHSWVVRTKAVSALGRLGEPEDVDRLRSLLGDSVWWVRFRAAQALLKLPFLDRPALEAISGGLEDRFARDMFSQVLAENAGARA